MSVAFSSFSDAGFNLSAVVENNNKRIHRVSVCQRFNEKTVSFFEEAYQHVAKKLLTASEPIKIDVLNQFDAVNIIDSSSWKIPKQLQEHFPGYNQAGSKIQLMLDYKTGIPNLIELTRETYNDISYSKTISNTLDANELIIFDQGYGLAQTLKSIDDKKALFLTRFNYHGLNLYIQKDNLFHKVDILDVLNNSNDTNETFEIDFYSGNDTYKTKVRLLATKLPDSIANEKRRKARKHAANTKKGRVPKKMTLALCSWHLLITNIPKRKQITTQQILALYAIRWQIELFFKQLKSTLAIHKTAVKNNQHRFMCEILAKATVIMLICFCYSSARNRTWQSSQQEISFDKTVKCFKRNSGHLLRMLLSSTKKGIKEISLMISKIVNVCQKYRQKSRDNSLDVLLKNKFISSIRRNKTNNLETKTTFLN